MSNDYTNNPDIHNQKPRTSQRDITPTAVDYRHDKNFNPSTKTLQWKTTSGEVFAEFDFVKGTCTISQVILQFLSLLNNINVISVLNAAGTQVYLLKVDSGGFGVTIQNELDFASNTNNKLLENFGVVAQLADTAGAHRFKVKDSSGVDVFWIYSNGELQMLKAKFFELLGDVVDPGGGVAHTARVFVQSNAGKENLRVEFPTGASVLIAAEP